MKKFFWVTSFLFVLVITNILSFSQGHFLGRIDSDLLSDANAAFFTTERYQQLREIDDSSVQSVVNEDERMLTRLIWYYGKYLETGVHKYDGLFFFDVRGLYMHRDQYEDSLNNAVLYRIESPILSQGTVFYPYSTILDLSSEKDVIRGEYEEQYLQEQAYYNAAIQHVQDNITHNK